MSTVTGAHSIVVYRWEDDGEFNQDPGTLSDSTNKVFGAGEVFDPQDRENNPERLHGPFDRSTEEIVEMQFDGSWGADFTMTNTWWLQFIYGAPTVSGVDEDSDGTNEYWEHQYDLHPRDPPKSAQIIEEIHYPDGTVEQIIYKGCALSSAEVSVSTEDTVDISLDGFYAEEESYLDPAANSPLGEEIGSQPSTEYRPLHFGNSILRMDLDNDGTVDAKSLVQDASLDMEANSEAAFELGSRFAAAPQFLAFEPSISYTNLTSVSNRDQERKNAYGSAAATGPQETIADGDIDGELEFDAGTGTRNKMVMNLQGAFPDSYSRSNVGDPTEAVEEDIDRMIKDIGVLVESDTETVP